MSGLCQAGPVASALQVLFPNDEFTAMHQPGHDDDAGVATLISQLIGKDVWLRYMDHKALTARDDVRAHLDGLHTVDVPMIHFTAFHPDICGVRSLAKGRGIEPQAHSAIVAWAWRNRLARTQVPKLFNRDAFAALGYFDHWNADVAELKRHFDWCGLNFERFFFRAKRNGVLVHTTAHPTVHTITSFARVLALKMGAGADVMECPIPINDAFAGLVTWPVYPPIGEYYAVPSSYVWVIHRRSYDLDSFIEYSYERFENESDGPDDLRPVIGHTWDETFDRTLAKHARSLV